MRVIKTTILMLTAMGFSLVGNAQQSTTTSAATSSSTTIKQVMPKKPSKLTFSFLSESIVNVEAANHGDLDTVTNYSYVRAKYKTSNTETLEIRQYIRNERMDDGTRSAMGKDNTRFGDTALQYVNSSQGVIAGEDTMGILRLYVPTGKGSEVNKTVQLRGYLIWSTPVASKLTFETFLSPRFYGQFEDQTDQSGAALVTSGDLQYKINDMFSTNFNAYFYNIWKRSGVVGGKRVASNQDFLYLSPGVTAKINKQISLNLYLDHGRDLHARGENLFDDGETSYGLVFTATTL